MKQEEDIKKKKAVALHYAPEDQAPKVVASGQGYVAENILKRGEASDVPTYEDPALVDELFKLDLGEHIPPQLYEVVAQVLVFISDLDKMEELRKRHEKSEH